MDISEALTMGLVQGLTEFLPVSSSGHLVIAKHFLGGIREPGVLFEVLLHFGTLLAVLVYFRSDLYTIVLSPFPSKRLSDDERKRGKLMILAVVIGTIPTVIIALAFKDFFESLFESIQTVSVMLLVTGVVLFLSDRVKVTRRKEVGILDAVIIGTIQGLAIIPGISRSGSTIATGLFRGINGEEAARYSFLLSIPAILGAVVLESGNMGVVDTAEFIPYLIGVVAAAVSGFLSIKLLMKIVTGRKLKIFAFYCWTVGLTSLMVTL
jgi:undecaprenyl-diphosphatase